MDYERIAMDYPVGTEYEADLKEDRSLPRLGLYWAIMHHVFHNDRFGYASPEKISGALLVDAGVCSPERRLSGEIVMVPDSIAFSNMSEAVFRPYFDRALLLIEKHWGIPIGDLLREGKRLNTKRTTGLYDGRSEAPQRGNSSSQGEGPERAKAG
jgi:hypothetical protein